MNTFILILIYCSIFIQIYAILQSVPFYITKKSGERLKVCYKKQKVTLHMTLTSCVIGHKKIPYKTKITKNF